MIGGIKIGGTSTGIIGVIRVGITGGVTQPTDHGHEGVGVGTYVHHGFPEMVLITVILVKSSSSS